MNVQKLQQKGWKNSNQTNANIEHPSYWLFDVWEHLITLTWWEMWKRIDKNNKMENVKGLKFEMKIIMSLDCDDTQHKKFIS